MKHLITLALVAAATAAQAAPFAVTLTGTINASTFAEVRSGERFAVTLVYDNGGNTAISQTWQTGDLRCAIWRMNNDAGVVYTQTSFNGVVPTNPRTDTSGALITLPTIVAHGSQNNSYTVSGMALTSAPTWNAADGDSNMTFKDGDDARSFFSGFRLPKAWSPPVAVASPCATSPLPPGVPTHIVTTPGNGQVSVYWKAPVGGTASSAPASYTVVAMTGTMERGTCTVTHPGTSCTIIGLPNDTSHQFLVSASDASGAKSPSARVYGTPSAPPAPSTVTQVSANPGDEAVTVEWQTVPAGGTPPASYTATAVPGYATCTVAAPALRCTVPGLANGTRYSFYVKATGANGRTSDESLPWAYATPRAVPGTPSVPTGLAATAGNAQVMLAWDAPPAGTPVPTSYTVNAQPGGGSCVTTHPTRTCTVGNLTNGTQYRFSVRATQVGAGGGTSAQSPEMVATPMALVTPITPAGLTARPGNAQVTLVWDAPPVGTPQPTSYIVNAQPGGGSCTAAYPARTCTVGNLSNGTQYRFTVQASRTGGGTSSPSAEVSGTPQAAAPGSVQAVPAVGVPALALLGLCATALGAMRLRRMNKA
ncbi:MAG: fibronectin type III domain-containing protein [Burkholderiaceae bacterium]|jgi:hypothetical protein|nr:fibronectin type III domain-containing protein [Burkholderiaceae bacterium]